MRILKYRIELPRGISNETVINIPEDATVLCIHSQRNGVYLWIATEKENELREVSLKTFTTGEEFDFTEDLDYLGTAFLDGERFVTHIFVEEA